MSKSKRSHLIRIAVGISCLLLILLACVPLAKYWKKQRAEANVEALTRAAQARIALETAIGFSRIGFSDIFVAPEHLQARYIDEDYKLHVRLYAPTTEQEQAIRDTLADYADIVIYESAGEDLEARKARCAAIEEILKAQSFPVKQVCYNDIRGDYYVIIEDDAALLAADTWVRAQQDYPFEDSVSRIHITDYGYFDLDHKAYLLAKEGAQALDAWIKEQTRMVPTVSGNNARYWYAEPETAPPILGRYVGGDSALHIILEADADNAQRNAIQRALREYTDVIIFEYGGYPKEEKLRHFEAVYGQLVELGLAKGGHADTLEPVLAIYLDPADLLCVQPLFQTDSPSPFNNSKFTLRLEAMTGTFILE